METTIQQIQEVQQILRRVNLYKTTTKHIIIKLLKTTGTEKTLEGSKENVGRLLIRNNESH